MHTKRLISSMVLLGTAIALLIAHEVRVLLQLSATPDPDADLEFSFPAERTRVVVAPDGGRLHVAECGYGPPVLLLHGHGASMRTFALLARHLADGGRRVVALDQRGFGQSSPVPASFGFSGLVDDAATVLEVLDLHDVIVVGHSMGGGVALGLAIDRAEVVAERVSALVLVNSAGRGPADNPLVRARVAVLEWTVLERWSKHPRHGLVLARANFGAAPRRSHVLAARTIGLDSPAERRRGLARRLLGIDLTGALSRVTVPVLVLVGSADRIVPTTDSAYTTSLIPGARMETFAGAGHMLPLECSGEMAEQILQLADEVDPMSVVLAD